jgi:hypothetical protein
MKKLYNKESVEFGARGRSWVFNWNTGSLTHTFTSFDVKGVEKATKVASIINGAIKRGATNGLDGMARENIFRITRKPRRQPIAVGL